MKQKAIRALCLLLALAALPGTCACGQNAPAEASAPAEAASQTEETASRTAEETSAAAVAEETLTAERSILEALPYDANHFLTEKDFYAALRAILALHGLELTRYEGADAYYFFNYGNATEVKLLTLAKSAGEVEADRTQAVADYEQKLADQEAEITTEETSSERTSAEEESVAFDASKDVDNSEDLVISFVMSATNSQEDQQLLFVTASAVWAILNPKYTDTQTAFAYLKNALFGLYNTSGGASVSTIDGLDNSSSFTIPGNAVEAWLGTDEAEHFLLTVTLYAEYDEIIDIAGSTGSSFAAADSGLGG